VTCSEWVTSAVSSEMAARIRQLIQDQLAAAPAAPTPPPQLTDMFNRARTFFYDVRAKF